MSEYTSRGACASITNGNITGPTGLTRITDTATGQVLNATATIEYFCKKANSVFAAQGLVFENRMNSYATNKGRAINIAWLIKALKIIYGLYHNSTKYTHSMNLSARFSSALNTSDTLTNANARRAVDYILVDNALTYLHNFITQDGTYPSKGKSVKLNKRNGNVKPTKTEYATNGVIVTTYKGVQEKGTNVCGECPTVVCNCMSTYKACACGHGNNNCTGACDCTYQCNAHCTANSGNCNRLITSGATATRSDCNGSQSFVAQCFTGDKNAIRGTDCACYQAGKDCNCECQCECNSQGDCGPKSSSGAAFNCAWNAAAPSPAGVCVATTPSTTFCECNCTVHNNCQGDCECNCWGTVCNCNCDCECECECQCACACACACACHGDGAGNGGSAR